MGEQAVVAALEVEPGDLLDALQTAVERGTVHAQGARRLGDVAAVVEQSFERLDQLVAAAVRGERRDLRAAARAGPPGSTDRAISAQLPSSS